MANYDSETKTLKATCVCGEEVSIDVKADVEIQTYITIKEN